VTGHSSSVTSEDGFTLIEMIIAIAVLGIIVGPIAGSFLIGFLESTSARDRIADSSGAQVLSAWLVRDIQSSESISVNPASPTCFPAPITAGDAVRLQITMTDPKTSTTSTVSYIDDSTSTGQHRLLRAVCTPSASTSSLIATYLASSNGFAVACDGGVAPCADPTPTLVSVSVSSESQAPQDQSSYEPFSFELEARRRIDS
jgi:prepilin-type N-terminal cleavage/methylation domain-containing protein